MNSLSNRSKTGNPSSKSAVNYSDIGGATGTSTDNVYLLDGVDVTDHQTGTFGSNIDSESIQEQQGQWPVSQRRVQLEQWSFV